MPFEYDRPVGGGGGSGTVTDVSSADTSIAVTNPTTTPSLQLATLDVIATNEPPAAAVPLNSKKITGLANGTVASDAAAFGQIPTALPPNGSAGGDLAGSYPNPTVGNVSLLTTKGDLLYDSSGGVAARLGIGAAGQSLQVAGGVPVYAERPWLSTAPSGALAETCPRMWSTVGNAGGQTSGTLRLVACWIPKGTTVTSITFVSGTTALVSGTHAWFALYDDTLALLQQSTDDTSPAWASTTAKTYNLSSTYTTTYAGLHYLGCLVAAGTPPSFLSATPSLSTAGALSPVICGNSSSGLTGTAPNPAAAISALGQIMYAYIA